MTTLSGIALFATVVSLLFTALWFPRSREAARLLVVALLRCVRYTWGWCFVAMLYPPIMLFNWVCPPVEYKPLPPPAVSVNRRTASLPQYSDAELQIPPFSGQAGLTDGAELTISPLYVLVDEPGDEPVKSSTSVESSDRMSREKTACGKVALPRYSAEELQIPPFREQTRQTNTELTVSTVKVVVDEPGNRPI